MCWQQLLAVVRDMNICASLQKLGVLNCVIEIVYHCHSASSLVELLKADLCKEAVTSTLGCWFLFFRQFLKKFYYYCTFQQTRVSNSEI